MTSRDAGSAARSPGHQGRRSLAKPDEVGQCPPSGQLLKQEVLGTEAIYRVIATNDRGVEIEVVRAPGLKPGTRFVFALAAVLAMDPLTSGDLRRGREDGEAVAPADSSSAVLGGKD
jgi:hypothetical protein